MNAPALPLAAPAPVVIRCALCAADALVGALCPVHAVMDAPPRAPVRPLAAEYSHLLDSVTSLASNVRYLAHRCPTPANEHRADLVTQLRALVESIGAAARLTYEHQPALRAHRDIAAAHGAFTSLAHAVALELAAACEGAERGNDLTARRLTRARARLWREHTTMVDALFHALTEGGAPC